jgi:hypothetical protein
MTTLTEKTSILTLLVNISSLTGIFGLFATIYSIIRKVRVTAKALSGGKPALESLGLPASGRPEQGAQSGLPQPSPSGEGAEPLPPGGQRRPSLRMRRILASSGTSGPANVVLRELLSGAEGAQGAARAPAPASAASLQAAPAQRGRLAAASASGRFSAAGPGPRLEPTAAAGSAAAPPSGLPPTVYDEF